VGALWSAFEHAAQEGAFDAAARRELERQGRRALSNIIRRGVRSGAFRPRCALWAVERLPFAIVAGAGASWVFALPKWSTPSAHVVTQAALEVLEARRPGHLRGSVSPLAGSH
jgi:hypothetical protein